MRGYMQKFGTVISRRQDRVVLQICWVLQNPGGPRGGVSALHTLHTLYGHGGGDVRGQAFFQKLAMSGHVRKFGVWFLWSLLNVWDAQSQVIVTIWKSGVSSQIFICGIIGWVGTDGLSGARMEDQKTSLKPLNL